MAYRLSDLLTSWLAAVPPDYSYEQQIHYRAALMTFEVADGAAHLYPLIRLPSRARIVEVTVQCDAITGAGDNDVGLWTAADWAGAEGTEIDGTCVLDGLALDTVPLNGVYAPTATSWNLSLWEIAGLSAPDDSVFYDIVLRANADPAEQNTVGFGFKYVLEPK